MKIFRQNLASLLFVIFLFLWGIPATGQVTIGSALKPNEGALLDLKEVADGTSTKGLVIPRVKLLNCTIPEGKSLAQTIDGNAIGANWDKDKHVGLIVYNINPIETSTNRICPGIHVWNGVEWQPLIPYAEPLEQKALDLTIPIIRDFQYLESDPLHADFNKSLWPVDKQAAAENGEYKLGLTPKVFDVENNDYNTSRFYVGYKLITGTYNVQRSYKCNPSVTPSWENTGETIIETSRTFTDGIWTTENMRTKTLPNKYPIKYTAEASTTEPRYHYPAMRATLKRTEGLMYNWIAATNKGNNSNVDQGGSNQDGIPIQGICPQGWHLPSDQEWTDLENGIILKTNTFSSSADIRNPLLDYDSDGIRGGTHGTAMKSPTRIETADPKGSSKPSGQGGFDAYLTGYLENARSSQYTHHAYFWSVSRSSSSIINPDAWVRLLMDGTVTSVNRNRKSTSWLISVRCKKNDN